MTDTSVRNVLFDPRCGWALISGGVYLGISRVATRSGAMQALRVRERALGMSQPTLENGRTELQQQGYEVLRLGWERDAARDDARRRMRREL